MQKTTKKNYSFCHMAKGAEAGKYIISFDGRVVGDPEAKTYSNGSKTMAKFSVASNNVHKTINRVLEESIVKEDDTTFLNCTAFGYTCESALKALKKGDVAVFAGEATVTEYQGKKYLNVTVDTFKISNYAARNGASTESGDNVNTQAPAKAEADLPF